MSGRASMDVPRGVATGRVGGQADHTCAVNGGYVLAETLVALALAGVVLAVVAVGITAAARLAAVQLAQAVAMESERIVPGVLAAETRHAAGRDLEVGASAVSLRAFRAVGLLCGRAGDGSTMAALRAAREPDPEKDSVLVLDDEGEWSGALAFAEPAEGVCGAAPGERGYRLRFSTALPERAAVLVFERGAYHVVDRAFRYAIGAGGRQPLTEENLSLVEPFRDAVIPGADGPMPALRFTIRARTTVRPGSPPDVALREHLLLRRNPGAGDPP